MKMNIFPNLSDPKSIAIAEHYEARDLAIRNLVSLYKEGYDIEDIALFNSVLVRYGLFKDGFNSEIDYIIKEVSRRIK